MSSDSKLTKMVENTPNEFKGCLIILGSWLGILMYSALVVHSAVTSPPYSGENVMGNSHSFSGIGTL